MNRLQLATELMKVAKELMAVKFDTQKELQKYKQEHKPGQGTRLQLRTKQEMQERYRQKKAVAAELVKTAKELLAAESSRRFVLVLDKRDFRNTTMFQSILDNMGIPCGEEANWASPDSVELNVVGGKAY